MPVKVGIRTSSDSELPEFLTLLKRSEVPKVLHSFEDLEVLEVSDLLGHL